MRAKIQVNIGIRSYRGHEIACYIWVSMCGISATKNCGYLMFTRGSDRIRCIAALMQSLIYARCTIRRYPVRDIPRDEGALPRIILTV